MTIIKTTKKGISIAWDKRDGYLWNGKRTFDKRKIATIKRALFPTLDGTKTEC